MVRRDHRVSYLRQRPGLLMVRTPHGLEGVPRTIPVLPVPRKWEVAAFVIMALETAP